MEFHSLSDMEISNRRNKFSFCSPIPKDALLRLNLRGTIFITRKEIFGKLPDTYLDCLVSSSAQNMGTEYFFDRNPTIFHSILDCYNTGFLHIPPGVCPESVRDELMFWGINESLISKCCWKSMYNSKEDIDIYEKLSKLKKKDDITNNGLPQSESCRSRVRKFVHKPNSSPFAKIWFFFIVVMAILSLLVFGLGIVITVPRSPEEVPAYNFTNVKARKLIENTAHPALIWMEIITNAFLFFDLILRFWNCTSFKKFLLDIINILEFLSVIMAFVYIFINNHIHIMENRIVYWTFYVFGWLYGGRVFRILRLARHYQEMSVMKLCLGASLRELGFLMLSFITFSLLFALLMFFAETESAKFENLFICYWWSVITMTTVGYGDQFSDTIPGYIVGCLTAVFGVLLLAMPIAILSSNFSQYYNCFKIQKRYLKQKQAKYTETKSIMHERDTESPTRQTQE